MLLLAAALLSTPPALAPLNFLVGHCWRGTLKTQNIDTHCFTVTDGEIRDRHQVVRGGKPIYSGETIYAWNPAVRAIAFTYTDMTGGVEKGFVHPTGDGLDFGSTTYTGTDGKTIALATRWVRVADGYEARTQAPADPSMDGITRYERID